jgi:hypothetical protein
MMVGGGSRKMLWRQRGLRVLVGPWSRRYGFGFVKFGATVFLFLRQAEFGDGVLFSRSDIGAWRPRIPLTPLPSPPSPSVLQNVPGAQA